MQEELSFKDFFFYFQLWYRTTFGVCVFFFVFCLFVFFTSNVYKNYNLWSCQKVCDALVYRMHSIFIRFGTIPYRQIIGISMGTNCAPLVADLFLFFFFFFFFVMKEIS